MTAAVDVINEQNSLLTGSISTFLALSRLFAGGGEQLVHTLPELVKSTQSLGLPQLMQTSQSLAAYTQVKPFEFQQMGFEFNRLFVGPASPIAPPYESVYLSPDRLVMQEQTLDVRQMYQSEHLMTASQGTAPDDFIASELEFAAYLLNRVSQESSQGNSTNALKYLSLFNGFMQKHPRRWLQLFAALVLENSRHPVFPLIMKVLLGTIECSF
ncbi:molecular chaperone [Desulfosporosinus sp. SB140]|uniref:TorD/DmsD family molecular chaperone n=1 Tax=Desulfosporosinus paludis TaxID=3115649 RepID=UPI00388E1B27